MDKRSLQLDVRGVGWWTPGVGDWDSAAALLREGTSLPVGGGPRPAAATLPPNERRRAPEAVLIACEVAGQACAMAACAPADLPCVFTSMHGDIAITDILCSTLATDPLGLSPTRFHNSVHNAPVGYWTVATGCHATSTAVSAWHGSIAAGLLEAAALAHADATPVLFAAYDIAAAGPLRDLLRSATPFGLALLLDPRHHAGAVARLSLHHVATPVAEADAAATPFATALPLLRALARGDTTSLLLPNGEQAALAVEVHA